MNSKNKRFPRATWDTSKGPVYSTKLERFYMSINTIIVDLREHTLDELDLVICEPKKVRFITADTLVPPDSPAPVLEWLPGLVEEINERLKGCPPIGWLPTRTAADLPTMFALRTAAEVSAGMADAEARAKRAEAMEKIYEQRLDAITRTCDAILPDFQNASRYPNIGKIGSCAIIGFIEWQRRTIEALEKALTTTMKEERS